MFVAIAMRIILIRAQTELFYDLYNKNYNKNSFCNIVSSSILRWNWERGCILSRVENKVPPVRISNESPTFFKHFVEENFCKFAKPMQQQTLKNTSKNRVFANKFQKKRQISFKLICVSDGR